MSASTILSGAGDGRLSACGTAARHRGGSGPACEHCGVRRDDDLVLTGMDAPDGN